MGWARFAIAVAFARAALRDDLRRVEARAAARLRGCGFNGTGGRPVLVTCADAAYAASVPLWAGRSASLGWTETAVLALDAATAAGDGGGACVIPFYVEDGDGGGGGEIPALTGLSKFWASAALLGAGVPHVLSEMDVYHFGDASPALEGAGFFRAGGRETAFVAQRSRRSLAANIGFYAARADGRAGPAVAAFFRDVRDAWRGRLVDDASDGGARAVDQAVFNDAAFALRRDFPCVRRWGETAALLLGLAAKRGGGFQRNCTESEAPLLSTFDADVVTAGADLGNATLVWHIHRPNKTAFVHQLLSGDYEKCCAAKLSSARLRASGARLDRSSKYHFAPACAAINDPDDRVCHRIDGAWLPAMVGAGYEPRMADFSHTRCDLAATGNCPG